MDGGPRAAGVFPRTVPCNWTLTWLLATPHRAPVGTLDGAGGGGGFRGLKDLSAVCFSPLSSESGYALENGGTNHTASMEGSPPALWFVP